MKTVFRRGVATAMLWLYVRGYVQVMVAPWTSARLADPRCTIELRRAMLTQLFDTPEEQVDELCIERVRSILCHRGIDSSVLLHPGHGWG